MLDSFSRYLSYSLQTTTLDFWGLWHSVLSLHSNLPEMLGTSGICSDSFDRGQISVFIGCCSSCNFQPPIFHSSASPSGPGADGSPPGGGTPEAAQGALHVNPSLSLSLFITVMANPFLSLWQRSTITNPVEFSNFITTPSLPSSSYLIYVAACGVRGLGLLGAHVAGYIAQTTLL